MSHLDPTGPASRDPSPAHADPSPARLITLIVVAVTIIGAAILVGGSFLGLARGRQRLAVGPQDRAVLLTAGDLSTALPDLLVRTDAEQVTKSMTRDGQYTLSYHYDYPDGQVNARIECLIVVEPTPEKAESSYGPLDRQAMRSVAEFGSDVRFHPEAMPEPWGDQYRFGLLRRGTEAVGLLMTGRKDRRMFALTFRAQTLTPAEAAALTEPFLEAVSQYQP